MSKNNICVEIKQTLRYDIFVIRDRISFMSGKIFYFAIHFSMKYANNSCNVGTKIFNTQQQI